MRLEFVIRILIKFKTAFIDQNLKFQKLTDTSNTTAKRRSVISYSRCMYKINSSFCQN